jgi:hypothetical protein
MKKVDKMGQKSDIKFRENNPRTFMSILVQKARHCFYRLGYSIASKVVDDTLKPFSLMPTIVRHLVLLNVYHTLTYT